MLLTDRLTLNLAGSLLDSNLRTGRSPFTGEIQSIRLPQVSVFSLAVGAEYAFEKKVLDSDLVFSMCGTGSSEYYFIARTGIDDFRTIRDGSRVHTGGEDNLLINARLRLSNIPLTRGSLGLNIRGINRTDQKYYNSGFSIPAFGGYGAVRYGGPGHMA